MLVVFSHCVQARAACTATGVNRERGEPGAAERGARCDTRGVEWRAARVRRGAGRARKGVVDLGRKGRKGRKGVVDLEPLHWIIADEALAVGGHEISALSNWDGL